METERNDYWYIQQNRGLLKALGQMKKIDTKSCMLYNSIYMTFPL